MFLTVVGLFLLAAFAYLAVGYHNLKLQSKAAARTREELEIKYQAQLLDYQRHLSIGMPRLEVTRYLNSHKIPYDAWRRAGCWRVRLLAGVPFSRIHSTEAI